MKQLFSLTAGTLALCLLFISGALAEERVPLTVHSKNGPHRFQLEWADSLEEQRRGLMFRRKLPEDGGMLFHYGAAQPVAMWMKNTYIPLDMLFVTEDGKIVHIVHETEPHSETPVGTPQPVRDVIELPGGTAERLGITPGDRVEYSVPQP